MKVSGGRKQNPGLSQYRNRMTEVRVGMFRDLLRGDQDSVWRTKDSVTNTQDRF